MEKRRDAMHCVPTFFPPCINHIVVRGTNCCAPNWRASSLQDVGFALCFFPTFALRLHKL